MQKEQLDDKKVGSAYFENSDPELNVVEDNSEEKSNFSKITIIIIVALVLFVIIGGIFYYKKSV